MTQYPDETTRRHLLALTKAGVIKPGSIRAQVAEAVEQFRLIMEHAIEAEKAVESHCKHPSYYRGVSADMGTIKVCTECGEHL